MARGAHSACTQCEGELDESIWKKLEDEMLADRATIAHHRAHLAVLTRRRRRWHSPRGTRRTASTAVEAFVRRTVKETVINEDGTTEMKAIERVNKQHLLQALLMLATAETGTSVPNKKKLNGQCAAAGSTSSR